MQIVTRKHLFTDKEPTKMEAMRKLADLMNWTLNACKKNNEEIEDVSFIYYDGTLTGTESIEVLVYLRGGNAQGQ